MCDRRQWVRLPGQWTARNSRLLLHTYIAGVHKEGDTIKGLIVENKSGRQAILGKVVVVDATGDGDVPVGSPASCSP